MAIDPVRTTHNEHTLASASLESACLQRDVRGQAGQGESSSFSKSDFVRLSGNTLDGNDGELGEGSSAGLRPARRGFSESRTGGRV